MKPLRLGPSTLAIHAGNPNREPLGAVIPPIYQTVTFDLGHPSGYFYTRYGNPTLAVVEEKIAALEGAEAALVTASGLAAITTAVLTVVRQGDRIVSQRDIYGSTHRFFNEYLSRSGVSVDFVETGDPEAMEAAITPATRLLYIESPTNPLLKVVDFEGVVGIARRHDLPVFIDSTFGTPYNQQPIGWGVDVVLHSATKYLNGFSDVMGGAIVGRKDFIAQARETLKTYGGCMDPLAAFLLDRGMKTLPLRIERQNASAATVADFLLQQKKVVNVSYPGLARHPHHDLARKQMRGFGGMVTFQVQGGEAEAERVLGACRLWRAATSLGGVESLISRPSNTSHAYMPREERELAGIHDSTIRLSVGIEDVEDLIADLARALEQV